MLDAVNYIILDAARMGPAMDEARARNKTHDSLFRGSSEATLTGVAPYVFRYTPKTEFSNWYLKHGWGDAWGVFLKSAWPLPELHRHLQQLTRVKAEGGQQFIFRFYDPRILRVFLPTCDAVQLREFFGDGTIEYCVVEDEDPAFALRFRHENGVLKTERFPVAAHIAALPEPGPPPQREAAAEQVVLSPEALAALREKYPDLELPPDAPQSPEAEPGTPEPAAADKPLPEAMPVKPGELQPPSPPGLKTRWNLFD